MTSWAKDLGSGNTNGRKIWSRKVRRDSWKTKVALLCTYVSWVRRNLFIALFLVQVLLSNVNVDHWWGNKTFLPEAARVWLLLTQKNIYSKVVPLGVICPWPLYLKQLLFINYFAWKTNNMIVVKQWFSNSIVFLTFLTWKWAISYSFSSIGLSI